MGLDFNVIPASPFRSVLLAAIEGRVSTLTSKILVLGHVLPPSFPPNPNQGESRVNLNRDLCT